jgi:hypothetical protein
MHGVVGVARYDTRLSPSLDWARSVLFSRFGLAHSMRCFVLPLSVRCSLYTTTLHISGLWDVFRREKMRLQASEDYRASRSHAWKAAHATLGLRRRRWLSRQSSCRRCRRLGLIRGDSKVTVALRMIAAFFFAIVRVRSLRRPSGTPLDCRIPFVS